MLDTDGLLYDLLDISLEGEVCEEKLRHQIGFLSIREEEHTGTGLYTYLDAGDEIIKFRLSEEEIEKMNIGSAKQFTNIELINEHLDILADITIHIEDGVIDCVEIWNKTGAEYPKEELITYELKPINASKKVQ